MKKLSLLMAVMVFSLPFVLAGTSSAAISTDEICLLQKLSQQLEDSAKAELDKVQQLSHGGRYNEDTLNTQLNAFLEASKALNAKVAATPPDEAEITPALAEMKSLVLSIDDIFVYESGYDHVRRDWNECKRILRRIDGVVGRGGIFYRIQNILDSNQFCRDVGFFFQTHGLLGKVDDTLHGDKFFKPVTDMVGGHGGGRDTTHVWMVPEPQHKATTTQNRSSFNEDVNEF